jgi:hypothetical protein
MSARSTQESIRAKTNEKLTANIKVLRLAGYRNPHMIMEHCIAAMVRLTQEEKGVVALDAAKWLVGYAQSLLAQNPKTRESDQQIISELRMLYAKALPEGQRGETLDIETVAEAEQR